MRISQAFKLLQQGELEAARDLCLALLQKEPDAPRALVLLSAIQQRQGDQPAATASLLQAARVQAGDTTAQLGIIKALRTIGALAEAALLLDQLDHNDPEVAISRAQVEWQDGRYDKALAGFRDAAGRWPELPQTALALGRALLRLHETSEAEQVLAQAAGRWPGNREARRLLAVLELDRSDVEQALAQLLPLSAPKKAGQATDDLAGRMLAALSLISGRSTQPAAQDGDVLDRSFAWVRGQAGNPRWFGTNSGLLNWAMDEIPEQLTPLAPVVECGVYHGFSLRLIANRTHRPVHGFDSFQGLPESWKPGEPAGSYSTGGRLPPTAAHVQLHPGWFEDSLPEFVAQLAGPVALLHVDCDLYSSTRTVLDLLGPKLAPGGLLLFDDFLSYEGYEQHEFRAAQEYFAASPQSFELVGAVLLGRAVAYRRVAG